MTTSFTNSMVQRVLRIPPSYVVFAVLLIILSITRPHMLNLNIMGIFIRQVVPLGILVLGQLLVMRVRASTCRAAGSSS